eukprot:4238904-Alexandrium_andersonii.AAC.1
MADRQQFFVPPEVLEKFPGVQMEDFRLNKPSRRADLQDAPARPELASGGPNSKFGRTPVQRRVQGLGALRS